MKFKWSEKRKESTTLSEITVIQEIFCSVKISVPLEIPFRSDLFLVNHSRYAEYCIRTVVVDVAGNSGRSGTL